MKRKANQQVWPILFLSKNNMKKNIPTVTIAVSVYNEEINIKNFLLSVLKQDVRGFKLSRIIVLSDGSTDNTVNIARSLKSSLITVIDDKNRIGKSSRLNQIYNMATSDILVQSDADVIFSNKNVVYNLIQPIVNNPDVGMCGGHPKPMTAETFTEKAVNSTFEMYSKLRKKLRNGNNVFSADGRLLAYRKELYKQITVPKNMIANDAFTYFACLTKQFKYKYVPGAIVNFRSPQQLRDQVRQNTRFVAAPIRMKRIFDENMVDREYFIPKHIKCLYMFQEFLKNPIGCAYIYAVNTYCKAKASRVERKLNARWDMAISTKKI